MPVPEERNQLLGKQEQLEYLMRRFGDKVLHLAYFYLRDRQWAEDIAQEVFLKVYSGLDKFRGDSSYYTWIYRITVNLCRDRLRSWSFRKIIPLEPGQVEHVPARNGEDWVSELVESQALLQAVLQLPVKYREVVVLHYFYQMTMPEIAAITGVSEGAIRVRLHRARVNLKKTLEKEDKACES